QNDLQRRPSMLKKLALIPAVSAFAIATALAQSPTTPAPSGSPRPTERKDGAAQFIAAHKPDQVPPPKLKGTQCLGRRNAKVRHVHDILFTKDATKIDAYVVSVGGFLGMGSKEVALAPTAFQIVPGDPNSVRPAPKLKISMTKDELQKAPNFEPYKEPSRST